MSTFNIDIQDRIINRQVREGTHIDIAQKTISKVYVKFSNPQAHLKAMTASHFNRQHAREGIEKGETKFLSRKAQHLYQPRELSFL